MLGKHLRCGEKNLCLKKSVNEDNLVSKVRQHRAQSYLKKISKRVLGCELSNGGNQLDGTLYSCNLRRNFQRET